ncbi:MAG: hypothetical protein R3213_13425 [Flavobacteriaceae bacterium]|nr:hypothetical protein [Flavobacteriaceae bacterium]
MGLSQQNGNLTRHSEPFLYSETQRFNQPWLWVLLGLSLFLIVFAFIENLRKPNINHESGLATGVLIAAVFLMLGLMYFFYRARLTTVITGNYIEFEFFPLIRRRLYMDEIQELSIVDYGFVGGWGIRVWTPYGTVYNIRGKYGLYLKLNSGNGIVFGTKPPK